MAWHKGSWWPLFVKEWYGPRCSQHMLDPYSFVILVLGLLLHLIWGTDNIGNWVFGFLAAILVELVWEIIGNSSIVLKRIKANSGTSGEYNGKTENYNLSLPKMVPYPYTLLDKGSFLGHLDTLEQCNPSLI